MGGLPLNPPKDSWRSATVRSIAPTGGRDVTSEGVTQHSPKNVLMAGKRGEPRTLEASLHCSNGHQKGEGGKCLSGNIPR
jgi:hypothetical protein